MEKQQLKIKTGENDLKEADIDSINLLLKQLNPDSPVVDFERIKEVMCFSTIITLRDSSKSDSLVGMGTLVPIRKLFSFCGTIEDIIVKEGYRGQGLGKKITEDLIVKARDCGMKFVDLTSNPKRLKANELYKSLGFKIRETNLYRQYF